MKKNKMNNTSVNSKTSKTINSKSQKNIGFETDAKATESFKYDKNADHSFELKDCK